MKKAIQLRSQEDIRSILTNAESCEKGMEFFDRAGDPAKAWNTCKVPAFMLWGLARVGEEKDRNGAILFLADVLTLLANRRYQGSRSVWGTLLSEVMNDLANRIRTARIGRKKVGTKKAHKKFADLQRRIFDSSKHSNALEWLTYDISDAFHIVRRYNLGKPFVLDMLGNLQFLFPNNVDYQQGTHTKLANLLRKHIPLPKSLIKEGC